MSKPKLTLTVLTALTLASAIVCCAQDAKPAAPRLVIVRAVYEATDGSGRGDVTEPVRALVKNNVLTLNANNQVLQGDPTPGRVKQLRVEYTWEGEAHEIVVAENQDLALPPLTPEQQRENLLALLQSDAPLQEKCAACRQLARVGGKESVPVLAGLLAEENLSHMARYALEPMPESAAGDALREALRTVKGKLLVGVINSLGVRRDAKALDALTRLVRDSDREVASAAAVSLGSLGTPAAAKAIEKALGNAPAEVRFAVQEGGLRCADRLAAAGRRREAIAMYDRLRNLPGSSAIRMAATRGAILVRRSEGAGLLVQQLRSDDPRLFGVGLRVALELPGSKVTASLAAQLDKLPEDRQVLLIQILSHRGDPAAARSLRVAATKGTKPVRLAAIQGLTAMDDTAAVPALVRMLGESDADIAKAAQDSLGSLPGKEVEAALLGLLEGSEVPLKLAGLQLVGRRKMPQGVPSLLKASHDANQQVRLAALKVLGEMAGEAELSSLLDALFKTQETQEVAAVEQVLDAVCRKAGDPQRCANALIGRMAEGQPQQRSALLRVLVAVGGAESLKAVREAVKDANAEVRSTAVSLLREWKTAEAAPDLLELAKAAPTPTEKLLCLRGYLGIAGNESVPAAQRLAFCKEAGALVQRDGEKKLLLSALGGITSAESLALVMPYLDNAATKEEACLACVAIAEKIVGGKDAATLVKALDKVAQVASNPEVLKRAEALRKEARGQALISGGAFAGPGQPLFNGKDLTGWEGNTELWSVREGALTGQTTREKPTGRNTFLIWKGGEVSDFELTFKVRLTPETEKGFANSGVQFRSKLVDPAGFVVTGYQSDIATEVNYYGMLYEEGGRGILANVGAKVTLRDDANQKPSIESVGSFGKREELTGDLKPTEWNEYRVVAAGSVIQLFVNGRQTTQTTDLSASAAGSGILALQLHAGPPMMVQFKDLMLKPLKAGAR